MHIRNRTFLLIPFLILTFFSCHSQIAKEGFGRVVKVIDGDTYDLLLDNNTTIRIRMSGIDAPERGMPYYKVAKTYLGDLCNEKRVRFVKVDLDRYGRVIAKTYLPDGRECGEELVRAGLAWHYKKYSSDKKLAELENQTRDKKIGLWSEPNPVAPWDERKSRRGN